MCERKHRVQKLLKLVRRTLIWRLAARDPLSKWVHDSGKIALLGDACHPMLVSKFHSFRVRALRT